MLWIDMKYAGLLSVQLEMYSVKQNQPFLCNFRCPICGDSKKNKNKRRGYLYQKASGLFYKCHNCGMGTTISRFLEQVDPSLHKQYRMEIFKEKSHLGKANNAAQPINDLTNFTAPKFKEKTILDDLFLPATEIKDYLIHRGITEEIWSELYYCPDSKLLEQLDERYAGRIDYHNPRLVIPAFNRAKQLLGVTARAIDNSSLRYVTVRIDDTHPFIFGLDRIDPTKTVYCTEGPIDSFFVKNSIAAGSSDLTKVEELIQKDKLVLIFDNEPRNKEIVKLMDDSIKLGYHIVIWPNHIEAKDINEMVMSGISPDEIENIISSNTFYGLQAQTKYVFWKKL